MTVVRWLRRIPRIMMFALFYVADLMFANLVVAWEVLTPRHYIRPAIVWVPIHSRGDLEVTLLANLISFTPGTLSLEISEDRSALLVHALHYVSPEHSRIRVRRLEARMLRAIR